MKKSLITEPLGLYGWTRHEPVLLAALLSEEPLLLIGPHGCAKSFVLERLAESLGLAFRCYNASLINYDDLVGIPMPNADRTALEFITTPESIWEAGVVFIDEINRTRPDLQNKLFPIIHECRVQGRALKHLRYRWAAMNPPPDDDDLAASDPAYLGAEPLDAALADRFPFIVPVPTWEDLSEADQNAILTDQFQGRHEFPLPIGRLVEEAKAVYTGLLATDARRFARYVVELVPRLHGARFDVSTRRATMLQRCALAVHAARIVLARHTGESATPDAYASALAALRCTLPDRARHPLDETRIVVLCKEAWDAAESHADDSLAALLRIPDPVRRLEEAVARHRDDLPPAQIAAVVCEGIGAAPEPKRRALALATFLAISSRNDLPASVMETLSVEIQPAIQPAAHEQAVDMGKAAHSRAVAAQITAISSRLAGRTTFLLHHANLLQSFLPDGYATPDEPAKLSAEFERLWTLFALPAC